MAVLAAVPMSVTPTWRNRRPRSSRSTALLRPRRAANMPMAIPTPRRRGPLLGPARRHRAGQSNRRAPSVTHSRSAQLV